MEASDEPITTMRPQTIAYMAELAESSFERQAELNESIWRSLPFFAASLGLGGAIVGRAAADAPSIDIGAYPIATNALLGAATLSFMWALWWFWDVVRKRDYEIPASDEKVRGYAEEMTLFHDGRVSDDDALDRKVIEELRLFMIDQYGEAARFNFKQNAVRTLARSQVLLFMLMGFVLAFACEATIFVHRSVAGLTLEGSRVPDQPMPVRIPPPPRPIPPKARLVTEGASFGKLTSAPRIRDK